jgi:ribonuclease VapC
LLERLCVTIVPITQDQARLARRAYRDFGRGSGHPARLNFGDCFGCALAKDTGEPLQVQGQEFGHTDVVPAVGP